MQTEHFVVPTLHCSHISVNSGNSAVETSRTRQQKFVKRRTTKEYNAEKCLAVCRMSYFDFVFEVANNQTNLF